MILFKGENFCEWSLLAPLNEDEHGQERKGIIQDDRLVIGIEDKA